MMASRGKSPASGEWNRARVAALMAAAALGLNDRQQRLDMAEHVFGRPVSSWNDLSRGELLTLRAIYASYELVVYQRRERLSKGDR